MAKNSSPQKKTSSNPILDRLSRWLTVSIGTNTSIMVHTLFFVGIFALSFLGISMDKILLVLTTAVSLEAIYLAIFIQMTVNKTTLSLANVEEDIDDLQEDVDSLETNVKEISDDYLDDEVEEDDMVKTLKSIEQQIGLLQNEIATLRLKSESKQNL